MASRLPPRYNMRRIRLHDVTHPTITEGIPPLGSRTGRVVISSAWSFGFQYNNIKSKDSRGLGEMDPPAWVRSSNVQLQVTNRARAFQLKMSRQCHPPSRFLTHAAMSRTGNTGSCTVVECGRYTQFCCRRIHNNHFDTYLLLCASSMPFIVYVQANLGML